MKIDIPFELGDPVLRILYSQHDGYFITAAMFNCSMIEDYANGYIFRDYESAKNKLAELTNAGVSE